MITDFLSRFAISGKCDPPDFFGLVPWYQYLKTDDQCNVKDFQVLGGTSGSDFVLVGLALVDDLLRIAGFVAIAYVIYGGILYVTSQGSPEQTGKAQNTIQNALVGLVIAIISVSFVTFLGTRIGQ